MSVELRDLPSVDVLLRDVRLASEARPLALAAARGALARAREEIRLGVDPGDLVERALQPVRLHLRKEADATEVDAQRGHPGLADGTGAAQERAVTTEHADEIGARCAGRRDGAAVLRACIPGLNAVPRAPGVRSFQHHAGLGVVGIEGEADASQLHHDWSATLRPSTTRASASIRSPSAVISLARSRGPDASRTAA